MSKKKEPNSAVCRNKKASFRFELSHKTECGIVLEGSEVKSLREGGASLEEAFVRIERDELWLVKFHIPPYRYSQSTRYDPTRRRKLLAHKREIRKLRPLIQLQGNTLLPLRVYFNDRGLAKVTIAVGRGKTIGDKRQDIKARDHKREMDRAARGRR